MKLIALVTVTVIAGLSGCAAIAPTAQYTREVDVAKMQAVNRALLPVVVMKNLQEEKKC